MRPTLLWLVTITLLAAPVAGQAGQDGRGIPGRGRCDTRADTIGLSRPAGGAPRVDVRGVNDEGRVVSGARLTADALRALRIRAHWGRLPEPTTQRIELFTPRGHLYQSFAAEVDQDMMETSVPVAGTLITRYGLYGEWCLELYVEGVRAPVARQSFVLVPSTRRE
jgi:hypothetical protein